MSKILMHLHKKKTVAAAENAADFRSHTSAESKQRKVSREIKDSVFCLTFSHSMEQLRQEKKRDAGEKTKGDNKRKSDGGNLKEMKRSEKVIQRREVEEKDVFTGYKLFSSANVNRVIISLKYSKYSSLS